MKILLVHSRYSSLQTSGENIAVDRLASALRRAGMTVTCVQQDTDLRQKSALYRVEAAGTVATGLGRAPLAMIRKEQPDVVHVHNLFPNFGRSWVRRLQRPFVATLHNFRPLCPAGTFYRDGHVCTDCLDRGDAFPAVRHACYRGSRLQTLPVALSTKFEDDPVLKYADRLIVLNETMKGLYVKSGVEPERMEVLPNFLPDPGPVGKGGGPWVFVGRLSAEKGILELVRRWPADRPLRIVGDGPLRTELIAAASPAVEIMGNQPSGVVRELMRASVGLVFPSRWFEGSPMVYLESLAAGTPVLAWRPSSVADLVGEQGTGLVADSDLDSSVERAERLFPEIRDRCRDAFEAHYTETRHLNELQRIYGEAIAGVARE